MISLAREKAAETKTTLTQLSIRGWVGDERAGGGSFYCPKAQDPTSLHESLLGLAACSCAGHQGQEQKWSSLPAAAHGPEFVTLLRGPGRCRDLPCVPFLHIIIQCRTLGPQGRQKPQKSPASSAGKSWGRHPASEDIT